MLARTKNKELSPQAHTQREREREEEGAFAILARNPHSKGPAIPFLAFLEFLPLELDVSAYRHLIDLLYTVPLIVAYVLQNTYI